MLTEIHKYILFLKTNLILFYKILKSKSFIYSYLCYTDNPTYFSKTITMKNLNLWNPMLF